MRSVAARFPAAFQAAVASAAVSIWWPECMYMSLDSRNWCSIFLHVQQRQRRQRPGNGGTLARMPLGHFVMPEASVGWDTI